MSIFFLSGGRTSSYSVLVVRLCVRARVRPSGRDKRQRMVDGERGALAPSLPSVFSRAQFFLIVDLSRHLTE
jgi:hypothetical protein